MLITNLVFIQFRESNLLMELCILNSITINDLCILMCWLIYPLKPSYKYLQRLMNHVLFLNLTSDIGLL